VKSALVDSVGRIAPSTARRLRVVSLPLVDSIGRIAPSTARRLENAELRSAQSGRNPGCHESRRLVKAAASGFTPAGRFDRPDRAEHSSATGKRRASLCAIRTGGKWCQEGGKWCQEPFLLSSIPMALAPDGAVCVDAGFGVSSRSAGFSRSCERGAL